MKQPIHQISGTITRKDTKTGIQGLRVEAWYKHECDKDCLGSDLTNIDGSFRIPVYSSDLHENLKDDSEIFLKIRDCEGHVIYDNCAEDCRCNPEKTWVFNIDLVPDILWWHFSCKGSWKCPEDPLVSENIIDEIEEAVELLGKPGSQEYLARIKAIYCAVPPIHVFDHILKDACKTLQGDLDAANRYRDFLEAICSAQGDSCCCNSDDDPFQQTIEHIFKEEWRKPPFTKDPCEPDEPEPCGSHHKECGCEDPEHDPTCPCRKSLIPLEKTEALIMAALHISCRHEATAQKYILALLNQLCRFEMLGSLHRAAVRGLSGDNISLAHLKDMLEFLGAKYTPGNNDLRCATDCVALCCCKTCLDEELECCIREMVRAWSAIECYVVTEIKPDRACPGETIVICGSGFGSHPGLIAFRQKGGMNTGPIVKPVVWCDNRIEVVVPNEAGCGLMLILPSETIRICGHYLEYKPTGCIKKGFEGTSAEILKFFVKGHTDGECLKPGEILKISWITCAADHVKIQILNKETSAVISEQNPAEPRGHWDFTATNFTSTTPVVVRITVDGKCEPVVSVREFSFIFQNPPNLSIEGMEITQAIQYYRANQHLTDPADRGADNTLRMVINKTAWVRVYLRSGQVPGFDGGQLHDVNGTLTLERRVGGIWNVVGNFIPQNGPVSAQDSFINYDTERGNINNTLNFVIPANFMTGLLRFRANVASPYSQCPGNAASRSESVDVNLEQTLNAAFIAIGYNGPDNAGTGTLNLPAPTLAQCQNETSWAMTTYPVSGAPNVRVAATFVTNTPLNDPRSCPGCCSPNWQPLLQQVGLLVAADQAANPGANWVYYGIVNGGIPVNVPGCSGWGATGGLAGSPVTYAHEMGHQFGLPHARCGNAGGGNAAYPVYEPYDLPVDPPGTANWTMASIGEYGLDINNGNIANPNDAEDFMSYCGPRWISLFTHNYLVNLAQLTPQVIPTGAGAAMDRVIVDDDPGFSRKRNNLEPLIHILGFISEDGHFEVSSVVRIETRYLVGNGRQTRYIAQLLDDNDKVITSDILYAYESEGCKDHMEKKETGCRECAENGPVYFKAMLNDVGLGASLRIIDKDRKVVWQRNRPAKLPELTYVAVEKKKKEDQLRITWEYKRDEETTVEDIWIRWSKDEGKTWNALTIGLTGNEFFTDTTNLPSGNIMFQVMIHDGYTTVSKATETVKIPAKPPTVSILFPKESDRVYAESFIHLWGVANNADGNVFEEEKYVWYIDGKMVASGHDIWVENPGRGRHEIRLEAGDSEPGTGTATSVIEIK